MMINNNLIQNIANPTTWISKLLGLSKLSTTSQYVNANALTTPSASSSLGDISKQLNTALQSDPKKMARIEKINQKRAAKGLAPIDIAALSNSLKNIINNINISGTDFKKAIEDLRKQSGLGKSDMRELITKDLGKLYETSQKQFADTINTQLTNANAQLQQYASVYGTNSPQYLQLQNQISSMQNRANVINQNLSERSSSLKGMYKKKGGFFSKLKGAFKKFAGGFKKIGGGILNVAKNSLGKIIGPAMKAFPMLSKVASFIPGVGPFARIASTAMSMFKA